MEVLQDTYKDTKIGRIPKDWEVKTLEDVFIFNNGKGHEQFISENGDYIVVNSKFISQEGRVKKFSNKQMSPLLVKDITMVMSDIPNGRALAKCFLIEENNKYSLNQRICGLRLKNEANDDVRFFFYNLNRNKGFLKYNDGVSQTNLRKSEVLGCLLAYPPSKEQLKIADILSTVDEQISTTDKIIEKSKELKKGLMQKLFSEGIGHTEFKDTKVGRIPKDWQVIQLGELCEVITKGTTPTTNGFPYLKTGINFVKVESINAFGRFIKEKFAFVGEDCYKSFKRSQLKEGDILISIAGALGRTAIVTENILPANTNQAVGILRLKDKSLNNFIRYFLDSYSLQKFIERINVASAQANLNLGHLNKFNIPFPAINEQQKIVAILSEADAKIEKEQEQKAQLEALKKGLMQQLLTGKKRVKV
jgi:type I restriction enzyme S subunit